MTSKTETVDTTNIKANTLTKTANTMWDNVTVWAHEMDNNNNDDDDENRNFFYINKTGLNRELAQ